MTFGRHSIQFATTVQTAVPSNTLEITSISGIAVSPTSGQIIISVSKACTCHWRIKNTSPATNKLTEFPNVVEFPGPGTYTYPNGGTLSPNTPYYVNAWLEDDVDETEISSAFGFTTPSTESPAAPTTIAFTSGGTSRNVNEGVSVGTVVGTVFADGYPTPTFTEISDPDGKFTVNSDGSIELAVALDYGTATSHSLTVRATNATNYVEQVLTFNVIEQTTGGEITPDVTVSSIASLISQLDAWDGTGSATRYIALSTGDYTGSGAITLNGYNFTAQVIIMSEDENCGAVVGPVGRIDCTNLSLYALKIVGSTNFGYANCGCGVHASNGSTTSDCHTDNCMIMRQATEPATIYDYYHYGMFVKNGTINRCNITNNYIAYYQNGMMYHASNDGWSNACLVEGNFLDKQMADGYRLTSNGYTYFHRNWTMRRRPPDPSGTRHSDSLQSLGGDIDIWGYVCMLQDPENGIMQGIFSGQLNPALSIYNMSVQQSIVLCNSTNGIAYDPAAVTGPVRPTHYNDAIRGTNVPNAGVKSGDTRISMLQSDYNIVLSNNGDDAGNGPNGIALNPGNLKQSTPPADPVPPATYADEYSNTDMDDSAMIGHIMPPDTDTRAHWNTTDPAGPVGAYLRKKEIYDGIHPGNLCVPAVAAKWQAIWNADGGITS